MAQRVHLSPLGLPIRIKTFIAKTPSAPLIAGCIKVTLSIVKPSIVVTVVKPSIVTTVVKPTTTITVC